MNGFFETWKVFFYLEAQDDEPVMSFSAVEIPIPNMREIFWYGGNGYEIVYKHVDYDEKTIRVYGE